MGTRGTGSTLKVPKGRKGTELGSRALETRSVEFSIHFEIVILFSCLLIQFVERRWIGSGLIKFDQEFEKIETTTYEQLVQLHVGTEVGRY